MCVVGHRVWCYKDWPSHLVLLNIVYGWVVGSIFGGVGGCRKLTQGRLLTTVVDCCWDCCCLLFASVVAYWWLVLLPRGWGLVVPIVGQRCSLLLPTVGVGVACCCLLLPRVGVGVACCCLLLPWSLVLV
jgi:hypothetical protein